MFRESRHDHFNALAAQASNFKGKGLSGGRWLGDCQR
jgi:hypothetical protein